MAALGEVREGGRNRNPISFERKCKRKREREVEDIRDREKG